MSNMYNLCDKITVCMIHFNRPLLLSKSLPSYSQFKNIFVWDNNSKKENKVFLKAYATKNRNVRCVWSDKNIGWPGAINRMIIDSPTDWVLIAADDMVLGDGFVDSFGKLLEWKPNLEQIYLHTFDAFLLHKKTIARFGWWDEGQPNIPNFWEDNDWYLRLVEYLGYSPYVYPGEHIQGEELKRRLRLVSTKETMERMDNISYFSNCRWGISSINFDIQEITRESAYKHVKILPEMETAEQYYLKKWKETNNSSDLLLKDGTFWRREQPDKIFHESILDEYRNKYLET